MRATKVTEESVTKLAQEAGCSVLVALHGLFDANFLSWSQYQELYGREQTAIAERESKGKQIGVEIFIKLCLCLSRIPSAPPFLTINPEKQRFCTHNWVLNPFFKICC
ncbi:MAG: hypothetical protein E7D71_09300 [Varibaculum cambriense]|nr:hypothetical protein [Varibaculum cambriense]